MGVLPTFVVVGAMRSGTTALVRYLGAHPRVYVGRKEVHFFDRHFDQGIDWYKSQFDAPSGVLAVGEGTPRYMFDPVAVQRMARVLPDAKLVVTLREPVARAYSHYLKNVARGVEKLAFDAAVAAESDDAGEGQAYLARGRYLEQLQRLCEFFPREQLHVLLFDDLRDDPQGTYQQVCDFIGVDRYTPDIVGRPMNFRKEVKSDRVRDLAQRLPRRARNLVGHMNLVRYPTLAPTTRAELVARFADDNAALAEWLGRDLSAWQR